MDLAIETGTGRAVLFEAAGASDVGYVRRRNEDAHLLRPDVGLFMVADGVAGRADGDVASRLAVEAVAEFVAGTRDTWPRARADGKDPEAALFAAALHFANERVHREGRERHGEGRGMTTTFVGALCAEGKVCIAHVGDSRAYRLRGGRLEQLTEDHSVGNEIGTRRADDWILAGVNVHALTRAVGLYETVTPTVGVYQPEPGDVLLLCSDGLTNMLEEYEIAPALGRRRPAATIVEGLVRAANRAGGGDNTTVVVARWR